ncbi:hypothetical protein GIB67_021863 [Kingdonia uniflora]|uniref:Uncharacterized protein n=1 Tax=Kingdonia uniflora TaxID=39325 RepID=A0A7J7NEU3_9MAGN|nr:hypothetical protein GIB67_021863 [Kingdonia uniflora]
MESRRQNMQNIPIERFQSEMLPPKSAKSIPISHHKLLSPIKSSGFISEKSVAHIMEAAARIIDQGPQTSRKGEMPSAGLRSSSVPLRVRDLKDKVETAQRPSQRPVESNAGRNLRGQSLNKRWNGSENAAQFRACSDSEESKSVGSRNTGKSTSLAVQAKADVQRKEGVSFASRTIVRHKEHQDLKPNQLHKIQPNHQKNVQNNVQKKLPTNSSTGALRQNNQKQNYLVNTVTLPSNQLVPNVQSRKAVPCGAYVTHNKISKLGTKTGFEALDNGNEAPSSGRKSNPQKKQTLERNCQFQKCGTVGTILVSKNNVKSNQPNAEIDEHSKRVEDNRRKGLDIVSFTFTSPMVKSKPQHMSDSQVSEDDESFCAPSNSRNAQPSSLGMNVIGEDSLSVLLEQKLRELTNGVESSCKKSVKSGSFETSVSILQDLVSDPNAVNAATREFDMKSQLCIPKDEFTHLHNSKYSTNYGQILKMNDRLQVYLLHLILHYNMN